MGELEIFFGEANDAAARIYARWTVADSENCQLTGRVLGPTCEYSQTLSATIALRQKPRAAKDAAGQGAGASLLAEAVVPDPCFWTTELPFLYRVQVELRRGDEVLASAERPLGIRRLGVDRRRLIFEGRGWVVRGADVNEVPERPLADWRAADLVMMVEQPDEALCEEASRLGMLLIAELSDGNPSLAEELRRLARWPAVAIALLPEGAEFDAASRQAAKNLLVGKRVQGLKRVQGSGFRVQRTMIDVVVYEDAAADEIAVLASQIEAPVLAMRRAGWCDDLAQARQACDRLQRDLAGSGEFAGFLV